MMKKKDINKIYDASLKIFAEYGYKKATLADIARELNMTGSNFYRYFKGKKDLYEQTVSHALRQWQAYSRDTIPLDKDTRTQFLTMCHKAVEYLSINDTFRQLLIRDPDIFPIFTENDPYEEINNASIQLIKSVLKKGIDAKEFQNVDLEETTQLLWLIYKTFIIQVYVKNHEKSMLSSWNVFIDLITQGLFARND